MNTKESDTLDGAAITNLADARPAQPLNPPAEPADSSPLVKGLDLDSLRLPQNFGEALGVKRHLTRVPVGKPPKTEFFRVRPGPEWRFPAMILELKEERETYVLTPGVWNAVEGLVKPVVLHVAIDRRNNLYLIPLPLPGPDGRSNSWHDSLALVLGRAERQWVRCAANMAAGCYDLYVPEASLPGPDWPDLTLDQIVEIAFRGRVIDDPSHPVIRRLLGVE